MDKNMNIVETNTNWMNSFIQSEYVLDVLFNCDGVLKFDVQREAEFSMETIMVTNYHGYIMSIDHGGITPEKIQLLGCNIRQVLERVAQEAGKRGLIIRAAR